MNGFVNLCAAGTYEALKDVYFLALIICAGWFFAGYLWGKS